MAEELTTRAKLIDLFIQTMTAESADVDRSLAAKLVALLPEDAFTPSREDKGFVTLIGALHEEDPANDGQAMGAAFLGRLERAHLLLPIEVPITIEISSVGGDVELSLAIIGTISQMRREGRKVNAHVLGFALSAAFDIVQFCDHRSIDPQGGMMMHESQYGKDADATSNHLRDALFSKKLEKQIFEVLSSRTGRPVSYYQKLVDGKDYYVSAQEALQEGFVDEITSVPTLSKSPVRPEPKKVAKRPRKAVALDPDGPTSL
jgi:ATP-dependent protease ClpP protease subunit